MVKKNAILKVLSLAMVLMLAVVFSVSASGGKEAGDGELEFVTVRNFVMGNPPTNGQLEAVEEVWNKLLKEKINANMDVEWIEWADWYTKYNLLLASGEALDLIHTSSTWLDFWPNVQRGSFMALDDLVPKYAPLTWEEIPQIDWEQTKYEGKIYCFPENDYTQYVNHGVFYRGDWLKEFGMDPVNSFQELGAYYQKVKETKEGVYPFDVNPGFDLFFRGWFQSETDWIEVPVATGRTKIIYAKSFEDYTNIFCPVFEDSYLEYTKLMKEWGDAEYWRKDVLNYQGDTRDALRAGTSASDSHHTNTFRTLKKEIETRYIPEADLQFFPYSETRKNLVAEPITHGGTGIGRNAPNPERAVMLYELFRQDEEIYRLINYGLEGVQYEIKDGLRIRPAGYDNDAHSFGINWWGGRVDKFEIPGDDEWEGIRDLWKHFDSYVKSPYPYGRFVLDTSMIESETAAVSEVVTTYGLPLEFGKVDDVEAAVESYRERLKMAGIDKIISEVKKQLDAYKKMIDG